MSHPTRMLMLRSFSSIPQEIWYLKRNSAVIHKSLELILLRMYCTDTRAMAFMFNGDSSCISTIHPIDNNHINNEICIEYCFLAPWAYLCNTSLTQYNMEPQSIRTITISTISKLKTILVWRLGASVVQEFQCRLVKGWSLKIWLCLFGDLDVFFRYMPGSLQSYGLSLLGGVFDAFVRD